MLTDDEIDRLIDDFVRAAVLARRAGFEFVDVKHCHGYLGHELLSARDARRALRRAAREPHPLPARRSSTGIRADAPGLRIGVRLSVFDIVPFRKDADGRRRPARRDPARYDLGFGVVARRGPRRGARPRPARSCSCSSGSASAWCAPPPAARTTTRTSSGPALFPPTDGYLPPEDPLRGRRAPDRGDRAAQGRLPRPRGRRLGLLLPAGVAAARGAARAARGARRLRRARAHGAVVPGAAARTCWPAGRSTASASAAPSATARPAPRNGLVSGCYPLDPFYAKRPEAAELKEIKQALRA